MAHKIFLLVGKKLAKAQETFRLDWKYTQNWIAYEIGLACQRGIEVWVVCDNVEINFPVPYLNNYLPFSLRNEDSFRYMRDVLEDYNTGIRFQFSHEDLATIAISCPYENCGVEFNLHATLHPGDKIKCPHCLRDVHIV